MTRKKFILDPIDLDAILAVWKKIENPKAVYYACVVARDGKNNLYMESSDGYYGHCRVFFDRNDLDRYIMETAATNGYHFSAMKRYEFDLVTLLSTFNSLAIKNTDNGYLKITINSFDLVDLREIDVLWDGRSN